MAEVKLYRAIFVVGEEDDRLEFSEWCLAENKDNILSGIATDFGGLTAPSYEVLGWEECILDPEGSLGYIQDKVDDIYNDILDKCNDILEKVQE